ncbi:MAG: bifunctional glutamate N-acetyltransferase/amino-acid acetyltransferase ArgJ, partial [Dehalococcoidales bacterium]|nr:bifunctional glutamate N-acetyltransferase/amino-acid acetyltransferase ArgJ [Dehalococcoidales bacterium]
PLPMDAIRKGIQQIALTTDAGHKFERAIMTTDTQPKEIAVKVSYEGGSFIIGGCAKGSGMIHPNMATMLCFITTDASVSAEFLDQALREAVNLSFNMISVDGDTSPSDTVLVMANGTAKNKIINETSPLANLFQRALNQVCVHLAKAIARDGEGATKLIEVTVKGAKNITEARRAARTIVGSSLVKSAVYGCDPNWGRVTAALGRADVEVIETKLDVVMAGILTLKDGAPVDFNKQVATNALKTKEVKIEVDLHLGPAEATAWGCDLTEQYVVINSQYTT